MQVIVAERGPLVFVFNFSPFNDYEGYKVDPAPLPFAHPAIPDLQHAALLMPLTMFARP